MLVWMKFAFYKENENIKNAKKSFSLKTWKFKTILFNKYINKTMLAISCTAVFIFTQKVWIDIDAR